MRVIAILFCFSCLAFAQVPAVPTGGFSRLPQYLVGAGVGANPPGVLISLAVRIGQTNLYSRTTIDTPLKQSGQIVSSVRTGIAYVAANTGSCFLFFLGDTGIAAGAESATLAAYSAGGGVYCAVSRFPGLYIGPVVRVVKISSSTVSPVAEVMFNWSF